jgi:hypothetical protein
LAGAVSSQGVVQARRHVAGLIAVRQWTSRVPTTAFEVLALVTSGRVALGRGQHNRRV